MMSWVLTNLATMIGGSAKIAEILKIKPLINTEGGNKLDNDHKVTTLEVRDVKFRYPTKPDV